MSDVNGQQPSEKRKFVNRWKESFQEMVSDHGQLNLELRMEVYVFNVMNKQISETRK